MCLGITEGWKDEQSTLYYWYAVKNVFFLKKCSDSLLVGCTKGENIGAVALIFCDLTSLFTSICRQWTD